MAAKKKQLNAKTQAAVQKNLAAWMGQQVDAHQAILNIWLAMGSPKAPPRRPTAEELEMVSDITDTVGSAMHGALEEHFSRAHMKKEAWDTAVYAVQASAEAQVYDLLRVQMPGRSK